MSCHALYHDIKTGCTLYSSAVKEGTFLSKNILVFTLFAINTTSLSDKFGCVCRYLAGGVESGFKQVKRDEYEPRLLHVKGRRNTRVQQTKLAWASMNRGDVFILDQGLTIWVWVGSKADRLERIKGLDVARRIRDEERGGRAKLIIVGKSLWTLWLCGFTVCFHIAEEDETAGDFSKEMNAIAEGMPQDIKEPTDDTTFERKSRDLVKLYRLDQLCFCM